MRPLTATEAQRVLAMAASRPAHQRLILHLLLEYGLTAREICRLRRDDVAGRMITVRDKRGEVRAVTLRNEAAADLAQLPVARRDGQLLGGRVGPMRPDAIRRLLIDAAANADIGGPVSIHRARRLADTPA